MKKIFILATLVLMCQTVVFAQKMKTVKESDVPMRYVKDFQNQAKQAQNVTWTMTADSVVFMATFNTVDGDKQAIRFSPKSTETRYYVESKYYPHAIMDTIAHLYPKYKVQEIYIRSLKGKMTYQAAIARVKGFLFWRKTVDPKTVSFETDGKLIEAIDEQ